MDLQAPLHPLVPARFRRLPHVYGGPSGSPAVPYLPFQPLPLPLCFFFFFPPSTLPRSAPRARASAGICPRLSTFGSRQPKTQTPMRAGTAHAPRRRRHVFCIPFWPRMRSRPAACCAPYEPLRLARGHRPRIRRGFCFCWCGSLGT